MRSFFSCRWKDAAGYVAVVVVCAAIFGWLFAKSGARFGSPSVMSRDYIFTLFQVQSMLETGSYYHHDRVGMPLGSSTLDFPMAESWHFGLMKIWATAFRLDAIQALNLHLILTFPLAALTSYFVLRQLDCGRVNALVASELYAFLYYHIERLGHCFLVAYYLVPLTTLLLIRLGRDPGVLIVRDAQSRRLCLDRSWKSVAWIALAATIGSAGIYFAYFACFFLAVVGAIAVAARRSHAALASSAIVVAIVVAGLANVWPSIEHRRANGVNTAVARTDIGTVERYGLKLAALVLPTHDHPIAALRTLRARFDGHLGWNFVSHISLGSIGTIGFLLLIAQLFSPQPSDVQLPDRRALATLNLAAILLAATSAGGLVYALLVTPEIRVYERMVVYIAFFALAAWALTIERIAKRWAATPVRRSLAGVLLLALLPLAIRDQVHPGLVRAGRFPGYADLDDLRASVAEIELKMPAGAMIAQLPYRPFPEGGSQYGLHDYQQLLGPVFSKSLRWSGGAFKSREADVWLNSVLSLSTDQMLEYLVRAGFDAISLDRFGYSDNGMQREAELKEILGQSPCVACNGRYSFFDLRDFRGRIVHPTVVSESARE